MTEEMNNSEVQNTSDNPGVQISVEQILASILSLGPVSVPLDSLIANYGGKNIAVNQDPDTKVVTFELADVVLPVEEDSSAETENNPA